MESVTIYPIGAIFKAPMSPQILGGELAYLLLNNAIDACGIVKYG
jgi:hypothetical protein